MSNETDIENKNYNSISSWDELPIKSIVLRGIYGAGFENPSPVQKKAILPLLDNRDIIAQAQSGTGKTACFAIGALNKVNTAKNCIQIIILAPTRELSSQIKSVVDMMGQYINNLKTHLLIGGTSTESDINELKKNTPQILVGCPGRVNDMLRRKNIYKDEINLIILDEADEMLSSGFKEQVYSVFQHLSNDIQIALFSATMPPQLFNLTDKFMRNPVKIIVKAEQLTLEGIKQFYVNLEDDEQKYDTIKDLFSTFCLAQCIIYCNSVRRVNDLYEAMIADNYPVCQIHSNLDKAERLKNYQEFKCGNQRVLISSNVTARGIDIQQVSTVINFDIPKDINTYLHRIGRSGRWGRKGTAINFITKKDIRQLKDIESHYATQISELPSNYAN